LIKTLTEELKPADFAGQAWRKWVRKWQENQNDPKKRVMLNVKDIFIASRHPTIRYPKIGHFE
jgi:hypothetical protein